MNEFAPRGLLLAHTASRPGQAALCRPPSSRAVKPFVARSKWCVRGGRQGGVTLVELLVAMLIGTILIAAALAVFIESRKTARVNQAVARIQENGLFAADDISRSLELAGYWGENNRASLVANRSVRDDGTMGMPSSLPGATDNCTGAAYQWYTDLDRPIEGLDTTGAKTASDANDAASYSTCIPDSTYLRNSDGMVFGASDILVVRYVEPTEIASASLQANTPYVRSSPTGASLFVGTTEPPGVVGRNYRYHAYAYYVSKFYEDPSDQIPTLKRARVEPTPGGIAVLPGDTGDEEIIIPGVESFHVQFGIDDDDPPDGSANIYLNANDMQPRDWDNVVAVRFWLVVRGEETEAHFTNDATYRLPQSDVTPKDNFRRVRITRTVQTRNFQRI
ncbi:MAG: type IV pilus assembly protein PilW [Gammaproteobacteria bacterium]|jgi:type IV pilus assembly protein PilW